MPRTTRTRGLMAAAAISGTVCLALTGSRPASAATTDPYLSRTGTTQLASDLLSGLGNATVNGLMNPAQQLTVGVMLSRPDPAAEDAYIRQLYDPHSPGYRQFMSGSQWQSQFGVSPARYDAAVAWLHSGGLTTTAVAGSTEYVLASGPAALVEGLLQTRIEDLSFHGVNFYANTAAPTVPADLGVLNVSGLESWANMKSLKSIHDAAVAAGKEPASPAAPAVPNLPPGGHQGATSPQDLWSIYNQPATNEGQGESMAIIGLGCAQPSDGTACAGTDLVASLRANEKSWSLPEIPIFISHWGAPSETISDTGGTGEFQLDLPASTGMAPLADFEKLYFGNNGGDPDEIAALTGWNLDPNGPRQGSWSYSGCEATPLTGSQPGGPGNPPQGPGGEIIGNPNQDGYEATLKETVAIGHTLFNSSGDLGANGCPSNANTALNGLTPSGTPMNNYPSSSTYVTTVGGTVLYWNGSGQGGATPASRAFEYSWTYSGGGTSLNIAAPAWQQATGFHTQAQSAPGVTYPCTTNWESPSAGPPVEPAPYPAGTFCRGLPDVAAQSGDIINGYFAGGGTSLSAPLWLGMWTRIQAASSNPGRLGFAAPAIYANNANVANYERDFFDVGGAVQAYNAGAPNGQTAAVCSVNGIPGYQCSGSGWDFLSGWGTPDVTNLMKDLTGSTVPVTYVPVNLPESPASALLPLLGTLAIAGSASAAVRRRRRFHQVA